MSQQSNISWTDATWNPIVGCSKISPGCAHCYATVDAYRLAHNPNTKVRVPYEGVTVMRANRQVDWTGKLRFLPERLEQPLQWKKPRKIFVNSMSDLFHEEVEDEWIDRIFAVMALAFQHTFQIFTKRPERMYAYFTQARIMSSVEEDVAAEAAMGGRVIWDARGFNPDNYRNCMGHFPSKEKLAKRRTWPGWPLPNVWLGVSCETQTTADARIPWLLKTPGAVRFVSAEPLLEAVDLERGGSTYLRRIKSPSGAVYQPLDWVICGGESGPNARPCHLEWLHDIVAQCKSSGVPVFVKQIGRMPYWDGVSACPASYLHLERHMIDNKLYYRLDLLRNKAGADPAEWPEDLRVQEFPDVGM